MTKHRNFNLLCFCVLIYATSVPTEALFYIINNNNNNNKRYSISLTVDLAMFTGFLFGLIAGGINNTGAVWGATDSWPTTEMQARYVN